MVGDELKNKFDTEINEQDRQNRKHLQEVVDTYEQRIDKMNVELRQAKQQIDSCRNQVKLYQSECEHQLKLKDNEILLIKTEVAERWEQKNKEIEQLNNKDHNMTFELQLLQQTKDSLSRQIQEKDEELRQLRDKLLKSNDFVKGLERNIMQTKLQTDSQQDELERHLSRKYDLQIKNLIKERDDLTALIKDKNQHIEELQTQTMTNQSTIESLQEHVKMLEVSKSRSFLASPKSPSRSFLGGHNHVHAQIQRDVNNEFELELPPSLPTSLNPSPRFDGNRSNYYRDFGDLVRNSNDSIQSPIHQQNASLLQENKSLVEKVQKLENDHSRVRDVVKQMKEEIETTESLKEQLSKSRDEIRMKDERIHLLEKSHVGTESAQVRELQQQVAMLLHERLSMQNDSAFGGRESITSNQNAQQVTQLNSLMTSLKLDLEDQKDKLIRSDGRTKLLDKENIKLRQKLKEALKDLKRTMKEREKLLDLSNMLKSQLDKEPNTSVVAGEDTNLKIQAQVLQMQDKLREVTENNIALKNELIRLRDATNQDKEEVSNSKKLRDMRDSLVANGVSGKNITLSDREELKKKSLKQIQKKKDELVQTRKSLRDKL